MHIVLAVATTLDGFINHVGQKHAYDWTSHEDQANFAEHLHAHDLYLMGRNTYEDNNDGMKLTSGHRRVVFTRTPEKYLQRPGVLEFTNDPIADVVQRLEHEGHQDALLLGGGVIFTEFLEAGLVDEVYLTLEPLTFGEGVPFLTDGHTMDDYAYLALESTKTLNDKGTKLFHYVRK